MTTTTTPPRPLSLSDLAQASGGGAVLRSGAVAGGSTTAASTPILNLHCASGQHF